MARNGDTEDRLEMALTQLALAQADIAKLIKQQNAQHDKTDASLGLLADDRADILRLEKEDIERHERIKAETAKTSGQRTQERADRLYHGPHRFRVSIPQQPKSVDPGQPVVEISANSPEEAQIRYQVICGINSCDWKYVVEPLTVAA